MKIREVQDRTVPLVTALLAVWEKSVRATHTFLSEEEIEHIKTYVPTAFHSVQHLLTAETASGEPVAPLWASRETVWKCCFFCRK